MDPVSVVLGTIGAVGGGIIYAVTRNREYRMAVGWRQRAEDCGLTDVRTGSRFLMMGFLDGRRGRHEVRLERYKRGKSTRGTRVTIRGLADGIGLKGEGVGSSIEKAMGAREIEVGDARFDADLFVQGPVPLVRALLDAPTRQLVHELFRGLVPTTVSHAREVHVSMTVAHGELRAEFPDGLFRPEQEPLTGTLQALLTLAERLAPPGPLEPRLVAIARDDPHHRVRREALTTLVRDYRAAPVTRQALLDALADTDPETRLQAGLWLGTEGRAVLEALAGSRDVPDSCSARALGALASSLDPERVTSILDTSLAAGRVATAQAALSALGRAGAASVDALARGVDDPREVIAVTAVQALAATGSPLAEEPLLRAIERNADAVRLAAAQALGPVGTVRAVLPLKELQDRAGGETRKAAREAVARIQSRLSGATPGQLALSEADASGRVSLGDDPRGRVGIPEEPR